MYTSKCVNNIIDAALIYDTMAMKYQGEFAILNFPDINKNEQQ